MAPTEHSHENLGKPCLRFSVNLRALPSWAQSLGALDYLIVPTSPTEAQVCANRVALAQKRGFACAVNYLEYPHISHHLLISEIDYKPRLFGRFQIKKVQRKIPSYGQLFYVECPKTVCL